MDKDRFDAFMRLAEFRTGIREARRQHEWRVSLGLWVGMGAGLISLKTAPLPFLIAALIAVIVCHAWFWVRWNWVSGERDARLAYYYFDFAQAMIAEDIPKPDRRPFKPRERIYGFLRHGPPLFQILATTLLAIAWIVSATNQGR